MQSRQGFVLAGGLMMCLGLALPARAESEAAAAARDPGPGQITVTATRPAYRGAFHPLEIPQADQVIGAQQLRDSNALDLDAALDLAASVARQNSFGGLWNAFAVRGFVGDENLPSNYLVNGFNAGRGFAGPRDLFGVEAVEVLKGPRAALFGRGEPGGTVNLVTKRPGFVTGGALRAMAGSFDFWRGEADVQTTVGNSIGLRLVGFYEDAGSFRDTIRTERLGVMPSAAVRLGQATRIVYELDHSHQEMPFDRGIVAINGDPAALPRNRFLGEPGDGPITTRALGHQLEMQHDFSPGWSVLLGFHHRDSTLEGFSTEPELAASRQILLRDGRNLTRQRRFRRYDATYQVARAELAGRLATGALDHRLLIGIDTDRFANDQLFLRARAPTLASNPSLQQLQAIDVLAPAYGQFPLPTPGPLTDRLEVQKGTGLYVQYQLGLGDAVQLRLGGRHDAYRQRLENRATATLARTSLHRFSPQLGAVWRATPQLSLYATYGENFRPLSGADFAGNPFAPNQSASIEAGARFASANGRLSATASLFSIRQDNILVGDPANPGFSLAAGEARSRGFEFDFGGQIAAGLDLWVSYAFVDARVENDAIDPDFSKVIRAGDQLLNIPEHTLSIQLAYSTSLAGLNTRLGGGVLHVGERLGEVGTNFELPGHTLVRLFAQAELTSAVRLRLDLDNLFNATWFANSYAQLWVLPGRPRTARVTASYPF